MSDQFPDDAAITRVANGFLDHSLPKEEWTHAAHFATTLWLLRRDGEIAVADTLPRLIRSYNVSVGGVNDDAQGYHHTITLASLAIASVELSRHPTDRPLHSILAKLLASPLGHPAWIASHWSKDRLFSVEARYGWVAPDLAPLPAKVAAND